uniref:rRNA processing protein RRP7 n=1 Tax=Lycosa singoriensis TaxID=434756 RepID=A9QQ88_LYCSI|nr:rRNA processing protein RRP7 [Lycosa singoriensis]
MESSVSGEFMAVTYKVGDDSSSNRHLFVKKHEGKDDTKPSNKTLFVLNVPQYLNKNCFKFLYKHCGSIRSVFIHSKPKGAENEASNSIFSPSEPNVGYKVAYVVFEEPSELSSALKCRELPTVPFKIINNSVGLTKWIREYNSTFLDVPVVTQEIETYMKEFDQRVEKEKQKAKDMDADEDGWVTVTKFSKKPKISRNEKVTRKLIEKQKKAAEKKTLLNFYRCQLRDARWNKFWNYAKNLIRIKNVLL